ncbi:unnamed protein product [Arctia plantaginis]|uniref:Uncharacterized protein n=1 Tax=Arctia plantaginis TaxID=874455 RepID=A0A8S1ADS1_ARCPL|nr:unnamed protein product [Arctia plantaginis]
MTNLISATSPIISGTGNSPKYEYKYEVSDHQTGDRKSHWEKRDGDNVRGVYTLYEPDGALRTVEYTADALHGFNAVVKREKPNKHQQRSNTLYTYDMPSNSAHNIFDDSSVGYTSDRKILPIQENCSKHAAKSDVSGYYLLYCFSVKLYLRGGNRDGDHHAHRGDDHRDDVHLDDVHRDDVHRDDVHRDDVHRDDVHPYDVHHDGDHHYGDHRDDDGHHRDDHRDHHGDGVCHNDGVSHDRDGGGGRNVHGGQPGTGETRQHMPEHSLPVDRRWLPKK